MSLGSFKEYCLWDGFRVLTSWMDTGSYPRCSTSETALNLCPRKAAKGNWSLWDLVHQWEAQRGLLVPGVKSDQLWLLWSFGEWASEWKIIASVSFSLCKPDLHSQFKKKRERKIYSRAYVTPVMSWKENIIYPFSGEKKVVSGRRPSSPENRGFLTNLFKQNVQIGS